MNRIEKIRKMLERDEGKRNRPYDDATGRQIYAAKGNVTVGIGRNLDAKPLSESIIYQILEEDVADAEEDARAVLGSEVYDSLSLHRQLGFLNLAFSLGRARLATFKELIRATRAGDFGAAGEAIRDSKWARDVDSSQEPGKGRDDRVFLLISKDTYAY